jgi:hypothetical protein
VKCYKPFSRFAGKAREVRADRAEFMRKRVADFGALLPIQAIDLGSNAHLPGDSHGGQASQKIPRHDLSGPGGRLRTGVDRGPFDLAAMIGARFENSSLITVFSLITQSIPCFVP